jgi:transposase, IS30 family
LSGSEFAYHEKISKELGADFYFAHPYSSWERGLNENTNGLVRQYIKKGSDISHVDDKMIENIANKLNNRTRKTLGYTTPQDIFYKDKYLVKSNFQ